LKLEPGRSDAYLSLASLQASRGRQREAEAGFKQAVAADPNSAPARQALANFYWITQRPREAEEALAAGVDPQSIPLNRALASLYLSLGRSAEAEAPLKRIVAASPNKNWQLTLADYYIATKRSPPRSDPLRPGHSSSRWSRTRTRPSRRARGWPASPTRKASPPRPTNSSTA
jgi:predicted Zn-dependent protease